MSPVRSTIVDSRPMPTSSPPSKIISILPSMSSFTYCASVGLGLPDVLALGAATNPPAAQIKRCAMESDGNRTATVSRPPVVSLGTSAVLFKIIVRGPGQKRAARRCAISGTGSAIL